MPTSRPIITLLTDFGEYDAYVGEMKGVILSIVPDVQLVDISHQVAPQGIRQAAVILANVYTYYPPHTVHLAVVDPGVGTERKPIALETSQGIFVAPDNGLLTLVRLRESSSTPVLLQDSSYWLPTPSDTFHGRDIFSPAAAHLARGVPVRKMGPVLDTIVELPLEPLGITPTTIRGKVVYIDRFGNLVTNIRCLHWLDSEELELQLPQTESKGISPVRFSAKRAYINTGQHVIRGIYRAYSMVGVGQPVAVVGSNSELEISVNQGNANASLAIQIDDPITLHLD